jgi:hypothetical protein
LCAKNTIVDDVDDESRPNFPILLQQHVDRFRPDGDVEFGMIEEMSAACWRQRRAWSIETRMFNTQTSSRPDGDALDRLAAAFNVFAASRSLSLVHRYETRLHRMYQRSLRTFIMRRTVKIPNDPSPISEHSRRAVKSPLPPVQAADSEPLGSAPLSSIPPPPAAPRSPENPVTASQAPAEPSVSTPLAPLPAKAPGVRQ